MAGLLDFRQSGSGPPVVLVHGPAEDPSVWDHPISALATGGAQVIEPRVRWAPGTPATRHVDDLVALLRHLGLASVSVVGLGPGAEVAGRLAARHPERMEVVVLAYDDWLPVEDPDLFADHVLERLRR